MVANWCAIKLVRSNAYDYLHYSPLQKTHIFNFHEQIKCSCVDYNLLDRSIAHTFKGFCLLRFTVTCNIIRCSAPAKAFQKKIDHTIWKIKNYVILSKCVHSIVQKVQLWPEEQSETNPRSIAHFYTHSLSIIMSKNCLSVSQSKHGWIRRRETFRNRL